jgi:hypothetical protein
MSTSAIIWRCRSGRVLSRRTHGVEQEGRIRRLFLDTHSDFAKSLNMGSEK